MVDMATVTWIMLVLLSLVLHTFAQTTVANSFGTNCTDPEDFHNGIWMEKSSPKTILFRCHNGYELKGPDKWICLSNGTWNHPQMPTCQLTGVEVKPAFETVTCEKPYVINGNIKYAFNSQFTPGDSILVQCNDEYAMKVDSTLVKNLNLYCSQDGKWATSDGWIINPQCSVSLCGSPPDVPHSSRGESFDESQAKMQVVEGQGIYYTCNSGYTMVDSTANHLVCINGEWQGNLPTCISLEKCPEPDDISHGGFKVDGVDFNDLTHFKLSTIVHYTCSEGYKMIGPSSIECLEGARWSHHPPQCVPLQEESKYCRSIKAINNGRCFCESKSDLQYCEPFFPGMHVECVCKEGYKLIGQSIVTCKSDGHWDYSMPSCVQDMEINDNKSNGSGGSQSHMSTLAIVVATACSVLGVLLLIMVIMVFRRRKPHPPRLCRPSSVPPPYSRVHSNSLDEQDRMLLIGYDNAQVALPSYEEAVRGNNQHNLGQQRSGQVGEYRPLPSIPTNFRAGQMHSGEASSRHSIITTSTMNRDGISEVFGSIDTVNVSMSDASTAVTIETCDSASSHHSNVSRRATAGSINSSNNSLVTEDVPLLESNQRNDDIDSVEDGEVQDKPDN
ncbi:P-selectin-like [Ruditapes philippinarum]|uniref:P-selectin-like n=1 Tax=Ruditapes philippinarum TaxID=129788 RepID=UPI00295B306A|nr:P-selectin-like [Ruditapes philippinarum]